MSHWVSSLFHNTLVSPTTQAAAWTRGTLNDGTTIDYGFGWHLETYRDIYHPCHDGSTIGFRNSIQLFPQQHLMVIVLTNRNEGNPADQAHAIADLYLQH
jgi:CubicO group peptidase (beta-lactamase class C family)